MNSPDLSAHGWQSRYDAGNTGWDRGSASPQLVHWLSENLIPLGNVLIPGCGRGHEAIEFAQRGFEVTAVDFAASAITSLKSCAERQGLTIDAHQQDIFTYSPVSPFDLIYEQTCLCAITPAKWSDYESRLHAWTKPGGRLLALFMQSDKDDGPPFHCDLPSMRQLFDRTRWEWPDDVERVEHPTGMYELATMLIRR